MKTIKVNIGVNTGFANSTHEDEIEVPKNITDAELDEIALGFLYEKCECFWEKLND